MKARAKRSAKRSKPAKPVRRKSAATSIKGKVAAAAAAHARWCARIRYERAEITLRASERDLRQAAGKSDVMWKLALAAYVPKLVDVMEAKKAWHVMDWRWSRSAPAPETGGGQRS